MRPAVAAANKMPGVVAGLCHDTQSAHRGGEDDELNVLAPGAQVIGEALALGIGVAFVAARFDGVAGAQPPRRMTWTSG